MKALLEKIRKILRNRRTRQLLARTVSGFAAVVVFVTTYALVLPAITMEQEASCGITAHEHTDACYEERLVCQIPEDENHHHDTSCYEKFLICGQQVHVHSTECYQQYTSAVVSSGSTTAASTDLGALVESELYSRDDSGDDAGSILTDSGSNALETVEEDSSASVEDSDLAADTNPESEATNPEASGNGISDNTDSVTTNPVDAESQSSEENKIAAPEENRDVAPEGDKAVASEEETVSGTEDVNDEKESLGLETADSPDLSDGSGSVSDASDRSAADTSDAGQEFNDSAAGTSDVKTENAETTDVESAKTAYTESAETAGTEAAAQEAANNGTTNVLPEAAENENLTEGYVPELDSIEFGSVLNKHTDFYYFHPEEGQEIPASSAEITDWKKVKNDLFGSTKLESADLVKLYLSYTIPAGALNETNQVARYRLPSNIHLTDEQIIAINSSENGMSALYAEADPSDTEEAAKDENAVNYQKYLGVEAIEGTRTPDRIRKEDEQEYISAIVKAENVFDDEGLYGEKGAFLGQDLIFIFTPYSIEKNQTTYNADGNPLSAGEKITGWFACDFNMSQIDWVEEDTDLDNSTVEKTAEIVFVEKDSEKNLKEISRTLKLVDVTEDQSNAAGGETASTAETAAVAETASTDETAAAAETAAPAEIAATATTASETAATDETALASTGKTSEQTAAEDTENALFKSGTLSADGDEYRITLDYTEKAKIPENAELSVREITAETDREAYEACLEQAGQQVAEDDKTSVDQKASRFFDIEILVKDTDSEGKEETRKIEPSAPVSVNIQIIDDQAAEDVASADEKTSQGDPAVLHFAEKGVEQIDAMVKESQEQDGGEEKDADKESESTESVTEISFEAESFSIYGVVYTVDFHWEVNGKMYDFSIPGGGFVSFEHLVEVLGLAVSDANAEQGEEVVENTRGSDTDDAETTKAAFTTYAEAIRLNEAKVSEKTKAFVADVEKVEFSNAELFWIGKLNETFSVGGLKETKGVECEYSAALTEEMKEEINAQKIDAGDWALISKKAFDTEETLTVTMKNGEVFYIKVTDAQISTHYLSDKGQLYEVTVTYGEDAEIPEGSTLKVTEFAEDREEYTYARKSVLADKKSRNESVDLNSFGFAALDISIINPKGREIEPEAEVQVNLQIKALPGVENLSEVADTLTIQHHVEVDDGVVVETVFDGNSKASFRMETNRTVAAEGTAVDPDSVKEEDFVAPRLDEADSIEIGFESAAFSTFSISWNNAYGNGTKIHYVDESGRELTVNNTTLPTTIGSGSTSPAYLIYDVEGYEYSYTYYNNGYSNTNILPWLERDRYGWGYYNTSGYGYYLESNKDIYVVYKKKADVVQGGTPTVKQNGSVDPPVAPRINKESTPNGDDTNTLALSLISDTAKLEVEKLADVIVVFDVSGSMSTRDMGSDTRLKAAKDAVNKLADQLALKKNSNGNPLVRMSLIKFSTKAEPVMGLTELTTSGNNSGLSQIKSAVNNLSADGGTNWDHALQLANEENDLDSGRATFVIFVTDGDPTFRNTRMDVTDQDLQKETNDQAWNVYGQLSPNPFYLSDTVYGPGDNDKTGQCYGAAVLQGNAIVSAGKTIYTIGISNDVTKVATFNSDIHGNGAYLAANSAALQQAFADIEASISGASGWGNIKMTDGITNLSNTVQKTGLTNVGGDFSYWKAPAPSNWESMTEAQKNAYKPPANAFVPWDPQSAGAAPAVYNEQTGAVEWNMGNTFMPEAGVTYQVRFKVWPSQEAYDYIAKLNNGIIQYDNLPENVRAQIIKNGSTYTLKTNEPNANTTYQPAIKTGDKVTVSGEVKTLMFPSVTDLNLSVDKMKVRKDWVNSLDPDSRWKTPVQLLLTDGAGNLYKSIDLNEDNDYSAEDNFISCGLAKIEKNELIIYETGHDFKLTEPEEYAYYWNLDSQIYRPMIIDAQLTMLVKVDAPSGMGDKTYYTHQGTKYYKIGNGTYKAISTGDAAAGITATNIRRSNLNLTKKVVDEKGNPVTTSELFTFTITINDSQDQQVWFSVQTDANDTDTIVKNLSTNASAEVKDGENTGYYYADSGSAITVSIQPGWNLRFTNLPNGTTYTITENAKENYSFLNASIDNSGTFSVQDGTTVGTGTINESDKQYTVTYINRAVTQQVFIQKTSQDAQTPLQGAVFSLYTKDGYEANPQKVLKTELESDEDGKIDLGRLVVGEYYLVETSAPAGYILLTDPVEITVKADEVQYKQISNSLSTSNGGVSGGREDGYTLVVTNNAGYELPSTGGPGTRMLYLLGTILTALAAAGLVMLRLRSSRAA